MITSHTWYCNH